VFTQPSGPAAPPPPSSLHPWFNTDVFRDRASRLPQNSASIMAEITATELLLRLSNQASNKAAGPDNLPMECWQLAPLLELLREILNTSMRTAVTPQQWDRK
jgi:hypothetical protein